MRINPFRALRPPAEKAAAVASVPYDVVDRRESAELADGNPDSFLHVVRSEIDVDDDVSPYDDRVYAKARENLLAFTERGLLARDDEPSLYLYRLIMGDHSQTGLVGCVHIDDYENDLIKKHEKTRPDKENDRTRHVLELRANAEPVILSYRPDAGVDQLIEAGQSGDPLCDFTASDGVQHTVWRAPDSAALIAAFDRVPASYVADGHHRCASAWRAGCELRDANDGHTGDEEYNWFTAVLFAADRLRILPYNRLLMETNGLSAEQLLARLDEVGEVSPDADPEPSAPGQFSFYLGGRWYSLSLDPGSIDQADPIRSLDADLLQSRVLAPIFGIDNPRTDPRIAFIGGIRGTEELEHRVDSGAGQVAFSMTPTKMEQVLAVSDAGEVMPPKSTWFEPKLRSGLFVHELER